VIRTRCGEGYSVSLAHASTNVVTVEYSTADGSAKTSDIDYIAVSGNLVFAPGETESRFPESYLTLELDGGALALAHLPVLEAFVKLNAMGWHTFLDMVDAAARGATVEPRESYMKRNAERYGVDLSQLPK